MNLYIGIDLGTSSLKGLLVNEEGEILRTASSDYEVYYPENGWSEQDPADWVKAMNRILNELSLDHEDVIRGISFGGQMHGLVALDGDGKVIRPCILWNDGRTEAQTAWLNECVGKDKLSELTGNIAFAGFTAPKLLWMREQEPENFARIRKIMLPKDYLVYVLTGKFSCDYSDASGMLLLDVEHRCWSREMCEICGVQEDWLPELHESADPVGTVKPSYGLPNAVVTAGAGDNAAAAIGTGTVRNGDCNISLGTSGTVFIAQDSFSVDSRNALHSFAHANGRYHLMGCILSAASCRMWWLEDILGTDDYSGDEKEIAEAEDTGVIFLPYLMGERSPHNDTRIRGAFIGLSAETTRAQMSRAVMEGVTFALKDCLEIAKANGLDIRSTNLCGGGARSRVWRQICADILEMPVRILTTEQGPGYGAAILAMVGTGAYASTEEAADRIVRTSETIHPDPDKFDAYRKRYETFRKLYPLLKQLQD